MAYIRIGRFGVDGSWGVVWEGSRTVSGSGNIVGQGDGGEEGDEGDLLQNKAL